MTRPVSVTQSVRPVPDVRSAADLSSLADVAAEAVGADGVFTYRPLRFDGHIHFTAVQARGERRFQDATVAIDGTPVDDYACPAGQADPEANMCTLYPVSRWALVGQRMMSRLGAWVSHWRPAGICSTIGMTVVAGSVLLGGVVLVRCEGNTPFQRGDIDRLERRQARPTPTPPDSARHPTSSGNPSSVLVFDDQGAMLSTSARGAGWGACDAVVGRLSARAAKLAGSGGEEATVFAHDARFRLERVGSRPPLIVAFPTVGRPIVLGARALLTAAQVRVAELAGLGATTAEIARHIERSPNTVHHHLKGIYERLGIGSRAELTRLMLERDAV